MSAADIDSLRLRSERERLFGPGENGQVRALVLALARPADWEVLGRVWKGVQDELGWPARRPRKWHLAAASMAAVG